ncbi:MAG: tetratricopeptide repeat protein [Proteobacteria bacterium]|nr:tetratricopeptide repeat protein [Pseudomonadota bacterium]
MTLPFDLGAPPDPLAYFRSVVADEDSLPLAEAAALLGQIDEPELDVASVLTQIDTLAARLLRRLPPDASGLHRARTLSHFFYAELGFAGAVNDWRNPDNSYLHRLLERRRGIPISLAVLYGELARQIGLRASGVSFPGHFLIKLRLAQGEVIIDPLNGQSQTREMLLARLAPLMGFATPPLSALLRDATPRETLARMLANLKLLFEAEADWERLLAVQHRLVAVLPDDWGERRDRGRTRAQLGDLAGAAADYAEYLHHCGDAADAALLRQQLAEWDGHQER